jgi:hypothetical protein
MYTNITAVVLITKNIVKDNTMQRNAKIFELLPILQPVWVLLR